MAGFDVVAIGASAGGLKALSRVLSGLSGDFRAALVVVQHLDRRYRSRMSEILSRRTPLEVREAREGDVIAPGAAYIAPPDHHLLVNKGGRLTLTQTELVHFLHPSADLLFESTAASFRERAIAVVLSGTGLDGAMGVRAIKKMGGKVTSWWTRTGHSRTPTSARACCSRSIPRTSAGRCRTSRFPIARRSCAL